MAASPKDTQITELKDTITQLRKTIEILNKNIEDGRNRELVMQEQIDYLMKKLFGRSSEKHVVNEDQISLFDEAEMEADISKEELEEVVTEVKSHTRKKKTTKEDKFANLEVKEVILDVPENRRVCGQCGGKLVYLGKEFVREEIEFIPATMKRIKYYTVTYRCVPCCEGRTDAQKGYLIRSKAPKGLMVHSPASPSSVAWVMYQKYVNAIPLYRQEQDWKIQHNVELKRATLANWIIYCATHYLKPLYNYFRGELLKHKYLMADETPIQVLKVPNKNEEEVAEGKKTINKKAYMWLFRSGEFDDQKIILYFYADTRAKYVAESFLNDFNGHLITDGYKGYNNLSDIIHYLCWAHIRRDFTDSIPKKREDDMTIPAVQAVSYIDKLFSFERKSKELGHSPEQRKNYRLKYEKPVIQAFWDWLDKQQTIKNSKFDKAVTYAKNNKHLLEIYLEDGNCSLSNNLSENAIRPFTVGRKNWLFSDTPNGAEASSICYTMVEMAKAHDLNPFKYLKYILTNRLPENPQSSDCEKLTPWNPDVQEVCKKSKKIEKTAILS
ncbi:MAG: IS66 family transposase [Butyrivibrio sp.]|nr:IS66 family transposase [Butyrivibrio sp.]